MDRLMLAEKLESLRRCIARIEQRRVDAAVHVLAETVQPAPATMGEARSSTVSPTTG